MKYNRISRRMFLQGTGSLLAIPFLESLAPSVARAQSGEPVKRYINYCVNFDVGHNRNWLPKLTTLANPLNIPGSPHQGSYQTVASLLTNPTAGLSPIFGPAFNPFVNKMMIYKGLDVVSHGFHSGNQPHLGSMFYIGGGSLDGTVEDKNPRTETIDNFLARQAKFDPARRRAYLLGKWGHTFAKDALGNVGMKGPVGGNAYEAYKIIFNNGAYPESGSTPTSNPRRDLLSRVLEDYSRVINGKLIGSSDRIILTNAMDAVSDLQRGVDAQVVNSCKHRDQDSTPANNENTLNFDDDILDWQNYIKLIVAMFQCDITRVISFGAGPSNEDDWSSYGTKDFHEHITHKDQDVHGGIPNWKRMGTFYGKHFTNVVAPLLTALDSCIDPANGKSFLHNGLMQVGAESNIPHRQVNLPTVTFGGFDGALPTGYMVNYTDPSRVFDTSGMINGGGDWHDALSYATDPQNDKHTYDYPGIPYQRFLVTVLQALGFTRQEYENPTLNKHLLNRNDSLYGAINNGITDIGGFGISSIEKTDLLVGGGWTHHVGRMKRYNWHYYKFPIPLPPKV